MKRLNNFFISGLLILLTTTTYSNNIQISNATLDDSDNQFYYVEFDVSWENSWRTSTYESNWDAAWIVVKFSPKNQQQWSNVDLYHNTGDAATDGHTVPAGGQMEVTSDEVGVFIYRNNDGIGDINFQSVRLKWDFQNQGVNFGDVLDVAIFATEMVYIPEGAFYAGDGLGSYGQFEDGTSGQPFQVTSEAGFTLGGGGAGSMGNNNANGMFDADDFNDNQSQWLPDNYPKGYDAFYIMKYEMSQQQYADFVASLSSAQREDRDGPYMIDATDVFPVKSGNHYGIADHPWRPMHYLAWGDAAAWADWAGLRPMSELEFEKACRGPLPAVEGELAWGNSSFYYNTYYDYANEGTAEETIVGGLAQNAGNGNKQGAYWGASFPLRCGIYAASATNKTRQETGATYYGVMEMTGNMFESTISLGDSDSRDFSGLHGDGNVTGTGNASFSLLSNWAFVNGDGIGFRHTAVSSRFDANSTTASDRQEWQGFRGVRSAE